MILNFKFGSPRRPDGLADGVTFFGFQSMGVVPVSPSHINLTDTIENMNLPINCVVAGQQQDPVKKAMGLSGAISGPLRGIFGE